MPAGKRRIRLAATFSQVKRDFSKNLSNLLIFDIFFKIIATTLFVPISAWVFNRLVASSGAWVIGNEQIISFVLSPVGMAAVIISGALALTIMFAEQVGIILITSRFNTAQALKADQAFLQMIKYLRVLIDLGLRQIMIGLLYLAPLAIVAGITFYLLNSQYDLNYLLIEKPPIYWIGAAIAAILGICGLFVTAWLYIHWIFAVPLCVLEDEKPARALRKSRNLASENFGQIAIILLGWALLVAVTGLIITFLLDSLSESILNRVGENPAGIITVVCMLMGIYSLTATALTFIGFATNCLLISSLYYETCAGKESPQAIALFDNPGVNFTRLSQRRTVWIAVAIVLIGSTISSFIIINRIDLDHQVAVTAHRGNSKDAPENTLSAVRRSIEDGAHFAEIDVQETADGVIVLLHDTDLLRVAGVNQKVWQSTYSEIKSLDAGSWFSPKFKGEHIPTLAETMELSRGKIKLNIELKFNGHEKHLEESVVKIIRKYQFENQCVITSLNYDGLQKVKKLNPALETGFIIAKSIGNIFRADTDFLSLATNMVTADVIAAARKREKKVHIWTVNSSDSMSYYISLGVDNIITDYPAKLVALIKARNALSDMEKFLLVVADILKR